jgi:hypothetical protein
MRWEDERYVRFYTRNAPEWRALSWRARGLFGLIMREVDRAGILKVGRLGLKGVAIAVEAPWAEVEQPLSELIADGCVRFSDDGGSVFIPNFIEAQEAPQSDAARKRASREKARAIFGGSTDASEKARAALAVTNRDDMSSQNVTDSHVESRSVTSGHSVPSVPSVPSVSPSERPAVAAPPEQSALDLAIQEPPRPKKATAPEVAEAITFFQRRWVELRSPIDGKRPTMTDADKGQLARLLGAHGLEATKNYIERFLSDEDGFLAKEGYALKHLPSRLDGYRTKAAAGKRLVNAFAPSANFATAGDKTSEYT